MNKEQIVGALRIILPSILAFAVGKQWLSADQVGSVTETIIAAATAVITLGSIIWSIWTHAKTNEINRVSKLPEVTKIVASPLIAEGPLKDNPKVVSK